MSDAIQVVIFVVVLGALYAFFMYKGKSNFPSAKRSEEDKTNDR